MSDVILETRKLRYKYPGTEQVSTQSQGYRRWALEGIDLVIERQKRLALLGANAAGKSTLLLHLNGTLRPTSGEILLEGESADYSRKGLLAWRQKVGMVFENPDEQLFASNVFQDVSFGPMNLKLPESEVRLRVEEALVMMNVADLAQLPLHMLSSGQRKRVAIAGVLAMKPSVLILDEPTAGLDPRGVEQLMETLEQLCTRGTTVVISLHNVDIAYEWADRVAILEHGKITMEGDPVHVMSDEAAMKTANLRRPWAITLEEKFPTEPSHEGPQDPHSLEPRGK